MELGQGDIKQYDPIKVKNGYLSCSIECPEISTYVWKLCETFFQIPFYISDEIRCFKTDYICIQPKFAYKYLPICKRVKLGLFNKLAI